MKLRERVFEQELQKTEQVEIPFKKVTKISGNKLRVRSKGCGNSYNISLNNSMFSQTIRII